MKYSKYAECTLFPFSRSGGAIFWLLSKDHITWISYFIWFVTCQRNKSFFHRVHALTTPLLRLPSPNRCTVAVRECYVPLLPLRRASPRACFWLQKRYLPLCSF
jgi:hypothetical protein